MRWSIVLAAAFLTGLFFGATNAAVAASEMNVPEKVRFAGPEGIPLVAYLFRSTARLSGRRPAVIMMHGRAGAYSSRAEGTYDATTLSQRHLLWGKRWAAEGYVALLVDGFGPRGFAQGFPIHSYGHRPEAVNEVTVRPADANAALGYLRGRPDVDPIRIALQGWSNGGSAALAAMAGSSPPATTLSAPVSLGR